MNDLFLGLIAVACVVMAVVQVGVALVAMRVARRVDRAADRVEQDLRPLVAGLQALAVDASRATSAFKSILGVFRGGRRGERTPDTEEESSLFIG